MLSSEDSTKRVIKITYYSLFTNLIRGGATGGGQVVRPPLSFEGEKKRGKGRKRKKKKRKKMKKNEKKRVNE